MSQVRRAPDDASSPDAPHLRLIAGGGDVSSGSDPDASSVGAADNGALVDGLLSGEPEAANALYDLFGDRVNRLVWRLLGADRDHDDLVQQVFVAILESVERLRSPEAFEAWVTRVTVNTVRKEIRRRQRWRLRFVSTEAPEAAGHGLEPDERLVLRHFYRVLEAMRPDDRVVFTLRFVESCTLPEIADACECSLATVKRRLSRARERFQRRAQRDFVLASALGELGDE